MPPINDFCDGRFGEGAMAVGEFGRHGRIFFGGVYCRGAIWLVIRTSVGKPRGLLWGMVSLGDWDEIDRISVFTLLSALRADSVLVLPPVLSCPKRDPACGQPCVLRLIRLEKSVLSRVQYCDYLDVRAGRMEGFRPGRGTACGEGNLAFRRFPESWHAGGFQVCRVCGGKRKPGSRSTPQAGPSASSPASPSGALFLCLSDYELSARSLSWKDKAGAESSDLWR